MKKQNETEQHYHKEVDTKTTEKVAEAKDTKVKVVSVEKIGETVDLEKVVKEVPHDQKYYEKKA